MKANELMIGDWVQFRDEFNEVSGPYKIDFISKYEIGFENETFARLFNDEIEPIPITPEILEKNGFEEDPESGELIWTDDDVTEVVWVGTILTIRGEYANAEFATCMFVHQLQHALRICGIDKEIEL